jgi:hypothetical protein
MSSRSLSLGSLLVATFVVVGCHEPTAPTSATLNPSAAPELARGGLAGGRIVVNSKLPAPLSSKLPISQAFREFGTRAINPGDYVCSNESSPVVQVLDAEIQRTIDAGPAELRRLIEILNLGGDILPTY